MVNAVPYRKNNSVLLWFAKVKIEACELWLNQGMPLPVGAEVLHEEVLRLRAEHQQCHLALGRQLHLDDLELPALYRRINALHEQATLAEQKLLKLFADEIPTG